MKQTLSPRRKERRIMAIWTSLVLTTALFTTSAFAADADHREQSFRFYLLLHQGNRHYHPRLGRCAARYVRAVTRCDAENAGRPVSIRWSADRLCQRNPDGNRRGVSKQNAPRLGTHFSWTILSYMQ